MQNRPRCRLPRQPNCSPQCILASQGDLRNPLVGRAARQNLRLRRVWLNHDVELGKSGSHCRGRHNTWGLCPQTPLTPGIAAGTKALDLDKIVPMRVNYAATAHRLDALLPLLKQWTEQP